VALAHRRLAVVDLTPGGAQPMVFSDGMQRERLVLAYNGELYNDAELRRELPGQVFASTCDTETLGRVLIEKGEGAMGLLRGMYAFAAYDASRQTLTLARDPLGIKPLYWARLRVRGRWEIAFASEVSAIVQLVTAATGSQPEPDWVGVSAYLTTIRTVMGERTLFQGVRCVRAGEWIEFDLARAELPARSRSWWDRAPRSTGACSLDDAAVRVREALEDSVRRHLRSDVPTCVLLSGGLDSTAIASIAAREVGGGLRSFVAGPALGLGLHQGSVEDDVSCARRVALGLGTHHQETLLTDAGFRNRWRWMVERMGMPLSTPNEVAIYEVARTLRDAGCVVTLSGEGADELLGGYDSVLDAAHASMTAGGAAATDPGVFQLEQAAWMPPSWKGELLSARAWSDAGHDEPLLAWYREEFARVAQQREDDHPMQAHLRWQRRVNLQGLLMRLDTATMLAGVEGRTPFADSLVADLCEGLSMATKYVPGESGGAARTKLALRRGFAARVPVFVLERPKASFPLPFDRWMGDVTRVISSSEFVRSVCSGDCISQVSAEPARLWRLSWPLANLALWGERWWGGGVATADNAAASHTG
jgi:asparagine synthase (glutamine-hydrolysing)